MEVREICGAKGTLKRIVPTVWQADPGTICILLDDPKTGRWLVITLDLETRPAATAAERRLEVA